MAEQQASNVRLHLGLFLATCVTTFIAGGLGDSFDVVAGLSFSGTLMAILTCHEMGHYVVARRHGIDASLPYFIPLPPMISLGTMGAVIRMREPIQDRNQLLDVGAAGPLAGMVVAIPLLVYGLTISTVGPIDPSSGALLEGNSLLYAAIKYAVFGQYLPGGGVDVQLHPIAWASWVGFLITMINLIPIGQLDGGHIAGAVLGRHHERFSGWLHRVLVVVGAGAFAVLLLDARSAGLGWGDAVPHAFWASAPWFVWAAMLLVMRRMSGGIYHPPIEGEPLSPGRRALAFGMLLLFIAIFTPVPLREVIAP